MGASYPLPPPSPSLPLLSHHIPRTFPRRSLASTITNMYITSSTFLALLSLLLPSMAAPVHFPTTSPASGNEHDYHPFGDRSLVRFTFRVSQV